jgi:hypothetical protein
MILMHEGSCLFIPRNNGSKLMIATDVTLTEACELLHSRRSRGLITGPPVRKVAYPKFAGRRQQSGTGWPKG